MSRKTELDKASQTDVSKVSVTEGLDSQDGPRRICTLWQRRYQIHDMTPFEILDKGINRRSARTFVCIAALLWSVSMFVVTLMNIDGTQRIPTPLMGWNLAISVILGVAYVLISRSKCLFYNHLLMGHVRQLAEAMAALRPGYWPGVQDRLEEEELADLLKSDNFFAKSAAWFLSDVSRLLILYISRLCAVELVDNHPIPATATDDPLMVAAKRYKSLVAALSFFDIGLRPFTAYLDEAQKIMPTVAQRLDTPDAAELAAAAEPEADR